MKSIPALAAVAVLVTGCTTIRETSPPRTASEQLLISAAADDAIARLNLDIAPGTRIYIDSSYVDDYNAKYAVGALREHFLRAGARLADAKAAAAMVVEVRTGAMSVDQRDTLVGIPSIPLPIPFAGPVSTPEIPFYKVHRRFGVAKFAAVAYRTDDGTFVSATGPQYGISHQIKHVLLFVFSWRRDDFAPKGLEK